MRRHGTSLWVGMLHIFLDWWIHVGKFDMSMTLQLKFCRWLLGYTCCDACGRLFGKGNYCPVCLKVLLSILSITLFYLWLWGLIIYQKPNIILLLEQQKLIAYSLPYNCRCIETLNQLPWFAVISVNVGSIVPVMGSGLALVP